MRYSDTQSDEFLQTEVASEAFEQPPFQFREDKSIEGTHKWLENDIRSCIKMAESRVNMYVHYLAMMKGLQWKDSGVKYSDRELSRFHKSPKHVYNFFMEMVDARVAQMLRLKSNIAVTPNDDSQSSINDAYSAKAFLDNWAYSNKFRSKKLREILKNTFIMGDSFTHVHFDQMAGEISPKWKAMSTARKNKIKKKLKIDFDPRIGEVVLDVYGPDRFFKEIGAETWEEMNECKIVKWGYEAELKADYPKAAEFINYNEQALEFNYETGELRKPLGKVRYYEFYHRPTRHFEGCKIVFTDDGILEWTSFPHDHGKLPFVRRTDVELLREFWGRSFLMNIDRLQRFFNGVQSNIARDVAMGSAPKWVMPKNSVDLVSINNEFSIMEYKGPTPPQLVTKNPTAPQNFDLQDRIESKITKASKVYDISRGEVPQGVTANSALNFLDEQERENLIEEELKQKDFILELNQMVLSEMQQHYSESDGRVAEILGEGNEFRFLSFKRGSFMNVGKVYLENVSAIPDSRSGKLAMIIDVNQTTQTDPVFKKKEIIDILGIGNDKHMRDRATVAYTSARTALQKILEGGKVEEPKPFDDLLVHYDVFTREMQTTNFKTKLTKEQINSIALYILTLENLMFMRASKNATFLGKLMARDEYPIFYKLPTPLTQLAQQATPTPPQEGGSLGKMDTTEKMLQEEIN